MTLHTASPSPRAQRTARVRALLTTGLAGLLLSACAGAPSPSAPAASTSTAPPAAPASAASPATPATSSSLTIDNCGGPVSIEVPPQRVLVLNSASLPALDALGVLDTVVATAGHLPSDIYSPELAERVAALEQLTDRVDATGHVAISREIVLAQQPDLVLGSSDAVDREQMARDGIALITEPAFCADLPGPAQWSDVADHLRLYGTIFERQARAEELIAQLERQRQDAEQRARALPRSSVAVLYPMPAGTTPYAYGTGSMSNAVVTSAGLDNVFGDRTERIFEVSVEDLLVRDPQVIVALHSGGAPAEVRAMIAELPGAEALSAVRAGHIIPLELNHAEPPTPLALQGLEHLIAAQEELGR